MQGVVHFYTWICLLNIFCDIVGAVLILVPPMYYVTECQSVVWCMIPCLLLYSHWSIWSLNLLTSRRIRWAVRLLKGPVCTRKFVTRTFASSFRATSACPAFFSFVLRVAIWLDNNFLLIFYVFFVCLHLLFFSIYYLYFSNYFNSIIF